MHRPPYSAHRAGGQFPPRLDRLFACPGPSAGLLAGLPGQEGKWMLVAAPPSARLAAALKLLGETYRSLSPPWRPIPTEPGDGLAGWAVAPTPLPRVLEHRTTARARGGGERAGILRCNTGIEGRRAGHRAELPMLVGPGLERSPATATGERQVFAGIARGWLHPRRSTPTRPENRGKVYAAAVDSSL
jgi:hypothetical protein